MIRAILVDDETGNLENLRALLQRHCPQIVIVSEATTVPDAVNAITRHQPQLLFLDIQMDTQSGFDVLRAIPNRMFEVIFVTAFDQYGIQAVKFAALDYLLKPVDIDELIAAVHKAAQKIGSSLHTRQLDFLLQHLQHREHPVKIALPMHNEIRYMNMADIVRCEADNTYTHFFAAGGEQLLVSKTLKEYADLLQPYGFIRPHQSHLVNPAFVKSWLKEDGGALLLTDGHKVPVSRINREAIKRLLLRRY